MDGDARPKTERTKAELLAAARDVLQSEGFAGLSTRRVADAAGMQMSQIQYHFGSKDGLVLALFEDMNARLIERQRETFEDPNLRTSEKWARACDYLEQDLASGYVRVLQELIAAGWSNPPLGAAVQSALAEWRALILGLVETYEAEGGPTGPFAASQVTALIAAAFIGAEAFILLGDEDQSAVFLDALRAIGRAVETAERVQPEA